MSTTKFQDKEKNNVNEYIRLMNQSITSTNIGNLCLLKSLRRQFIFKN